MRRMNDLLDRHGARFVRGFGQLDRDAVCVYSQVFPIIEPRDPRTGKNKCSTSRAIPL